MIKAFFMGVTTHPHISIKVLLFISKEALLLMFSCGQSSPAFDKFESVSLVAISERDLLHFIWQKEGKGKEMETYEFGVYILLGKSHKF